MDKALALAIWKSILRHHPFFQSGGTFGFDWNTFHACYPSDCAILRACVNLYNGTEN